MSSYTSFAAGGGSSPVNPDNTYQTLGYAASGALMNVQSGGVNTKGSYVALGTTSSAWSGFWLVIGQSDTNGARLLIDVSIDGGSTVKAPNIYAATGSGNAANSYSVWIPLNVPSGSDIRVKYQSQNALINTGFAVKGAVTNANSPPLYSTMAALTADTTNTRASTVSQVFASTATWTEQIASTAATYGAMLMIPGQGSADPAANQDVTFALAAGAAASEVEFWRQTNTSVAANSYYRSTGIDLIQRTIASGTRISASPLAATPGSMNVTLGLYGFS